MVDVRTNLGTDDFGGEDADAGRGIGVMGAPGLCSLLTAVNDGLQAGVCGDGAVSDT